MVASAVLIAAGAHAGAARGDDPPRLVVVVSADQFAYEYIERFARGYHKEGLLARIAAEGASYRDCHHRHAFTLTGPGHAVMLTGAYPRDSGIIGNEWFDRGSGKRRSCVYCPMSAVVGAPASDPSTPPGDGDEGGISPLSLDAPTVGDVLKEHTAGRAKVFGVAMKDRAGVLMAGRKADGAYWFDTGTGKWITSRYYCETLPEYVRALNASGAAERFAGRAWTLLNDPASYKLHRPDDYHHEGTASGLGRAFPHTLAAADDPIYYKQLVLTPFGNDLTLQMARAIIDNEQLGQDEVPDLLAVNLSSNDYIGHNYGPFSLEVEDISYRTDLRLGSMARYLDEAVGRGRWVLAVTADHGVGPIPEYAESIGLPGKRNPLGSLARLQGVLETKLREALAVPDDARPLVRHVEANQVYLQGDHPALAGESFAAAQRLVRDHLVGESAVAVAFTRQELLTGTAEGSGAERAKLLEAFRLTFHAERSGDVLFALPPYQIQSSSPAMHGSPWSYDTHVPMLLLGAGIRPGAYERPVAVADLAPTIAALLQIERPARSVATLLREAVGQ
jgi:predicted AlkP superfamily pyrophosphatase or phosphodiesterase